MTIERRQIYVKDLVAGFVDDDEVGAFGLRGRLTIRPEYQRAFRYNEKQQAAVIDTILEGYPIGVFYWARNENGYECVDGQQRTISICNYCTGKFPVTINGNPRSWNNIGPEQQETILNYAIDVYIMTGTKEERLRFFERINTGGEKLTEQELLNAIYSGAFVTDARKKFSKTGCAAATRYAGYISGTPINQDLLKIAFTWKARQEGLKSVREYMSAHQQDEDANDLWEYYQKVLNWAKSLFEVNKGLTEKQDWGELYEKYHDQRLESKGVYAAQITDLLQDDDVTKHSGIIPYILAGRTRDAEKFISIRTFTDNQKRKKLAEQDNKCPLCGKTIDLKTGEGDHIIAWRNGGKTTYDNLQMLCMECNRHKSGN